MALAMLFAGFVGLIVAAERRAPHNPEIDEGTYFVTARLVARGEPLYTATFCSQTPLYFELLALAARLPGDDVTVARGVSVVFALACLGLLGWLAARLASPGAGLLAPAVAGLGLPFFYEARLGHPDLAATTLALGALALLLQWRRGGAAWLPPAAGALFALAALFKLFVAPYLAPAAWLLGAGGARAGGLGLGPVSRRAGLRAAAAFALAGVTLSAAVMSRYDWRAFVEQAVAHHDAARDSAAAEPGRNLPLVLGALGVDPGAALLALAGLGALARRRPAIALGCGAWLAAVVIALLLHRPLYVHHVTLLLPVWSLLAGSAWLLVRAPDGRLRRGALVAVLIAPLLGLQPQLDGGARRAPGEPPALRVRPAPAPLRNLDLLARVSARESLDPEVVALLRGLTAEGDLVVGDRPIQIFRAGRATPPDLSDVGFKRIAVGLLDGRRAIASSREARAVVLWTGRLQGLPGFVAWVERDFVLARRFPDGPRGEWRRVYVRAPAEE